ncbi:protein phosphatase 2C domain-containing protein [Paenibacillus filicis]|uniref:Protein phosphatase 2C domain-containing protein n=1 Tax=Paenibacillus filicis TaxID=669464 RepID=A0ABU9DI71_9BACL
MKTTIAVHWQYGAATHSGWQRTLNDDRSLLRMGLTKKGLPYAVAALADGMGGLADGGAAADEALDRLRTWMERDLPGVLDSRDRWNALEKSALLQIQTIHDTISGRVRTLRQRQGTTLTLLLLCDSVYWIFHIGDCRVYRLNPGKLRISRLTRDHSWVARQVRLGLMSAATADRHPRRNVLLRYLGMAGQARVDVRCGLYDQHTLFMLSSDGLHGPLTAARLSQELLEANGRGNDVQTLCDALLSQTLEGPAPDNASIVALRPMDRGRTGLNRLQVRISLIVHRVLHPRLAVPFRN